MKRYLLAPVLAAAVPARAQTAAPPLPPVRPLGAVVARAAEPLGALAAVRALPGGRLLVNDAARRRVLLFDSTLATFTVVADSTSATGNAYGGRMAGLIPYRGDSTLFVDPQSLSMLVIDPAGKLGRTLSVPRPDDALALTGLAFGTPGFDARGRLVYRPMPRPRMNAGSGPMPAPVFPDSAPVLRVDLATRAVDTAAFVKMQKITMRMAQDANGRMSMTSKIDPLPVVDDWAVLSDGTIAVLRGRDFHVDLVGADGRLTSAPKVPHEWQRLSDEDKTAFLDSTRTAMEKMRATMQATMQAGGASGGGTRVAAGNGVGGGDGAPVVMMRIEGGPPPRGGSSGGGPGAGAGPGGMTMPTLEFVSANELPDYKPPFAAGAARADADGNVWVRTIPTKPMAGPVYDVIDRQGRLVDRVMVPAGASIAGFGPGGVVYLGTRDAAGVHLQRARAR